MDRENLGPVGIRMIIMKATVSTPHYSSPTPIGDPVNLLVRSTQTIEIKSFTLDSRLRGNDGRVTGMMEEL